MGWRRSSRGCCRASAVGHRQLLDGSTDHAFGYFRTFSALSRVDHHVRWHPSGSSECVPSRHAIGGGEMASEAPFGGVAVPTADGTSARVKELVGALFLHVPLLVWALLLSSYVIYDQGLADAPALVYLAGGVVIGSFWRASSWRCGGAVASISGRCPWPGCSWRQWAISPGPCSSGHAAAAGSFGLVCLFARSTFLRWRRHEGPYSPSSALWASRLLLSHPSWSWHPSGLSASTSTAGETCRSLTRPSFEKERRFKRTVRNRSWRSSPFRTRVTETAVSISRCFLGTSLTA